MDMNQHERETTRLGPARVRIGLLDESDKRTYYLVDSHIPTRCPRRIMFADGPAYMVTTSEIINGKIVDSIRIFDPGADPTIIIDHENYYGDRIDAERMTLDEYLDRD